MKPLKEVTGLATFFPLARLSAPMKQSSEPLIQNNSPISKHYKNIKNAMQK
jgi:hypothetical protein